MTTEWEWSAGEQREMEYDVGMGRWGAGHGNLSTPKTTSRNQILSMQWEPLSVLEVV